MPNSANLLLMKSRLDEALKKKMPADLRRDLATLRFAADLRLALRQKSPALDDLSIRNTM